MSEMRKPADNEKCEVCERWKNRPLTVNAIVMRNEQILLILRSATPFQGMWALPGGHVDFNETLKEAVARELKEETGLSMITAHLVDIADDPHRSPDQKIALNYIVTVEGEPMAADDAQDYMWCDIDKIPDELAFDHKRIINAACDEYFLRE